MVKCAKCSKLVTKKSPGIQCSKCNKWLHNGCAQLTLEQVNTLYQMESADWKCGSCMNTKGAKPKRLSFVLPDLEDEETPDLENQADLLSMPGVKELLKEMVGRMQEEVSNIITNELQKSLQFYSDKIDEFEGKIKKHESQFKTIENRYIDLKNVCKNLQLRYESLEQKYHNLQQDNLASYIELCGVEAVENENIDDIVKTVSAELKQNSYDIITAYQKPPPKRTSQNKPMPVIVISLKQGCKDKWLQANKDITILPNKNEIVSGRPKIYLREALSPSVAYLLYKTKEELKKTGICKYVWFKEGTILVRKQEKDKIYKIKVESDITKIAEALKKGQNHDQI